MLPLRIGAFTPAAPVVLAPMAGVTNEPFRAMCREHAPDLLYVNEMVMATAVVYRNDKTLRMMTFGPDERPRSLQIYGSDPDMLGRAVHMVCDEGLVDHVDLNFGCPAAKVTRRGGGAAVPAKPRLLRAVVRAAVRAAQPYGVPVTAKFRMGLWDDLRTDVETGVICADEGVHWIALHARTVEQHYAGEARLGRDRRAQAGGRRHPRARQRRHLGGVGRGRDDGGDGLRRGRDRARLPRPPVVVRRPRDRAQRRHRACAASTRCRRRDDASSRPPADRALRAARRRVVRDARLPQAHQLVHVGVSGRAPRCGGGCRRSRRSPSSTPSSTSSTRRPRWSTAASASSAATANGPIKVSLPEHFLDDRDELVIPDDNDVMALSGG